VPPDDPDRTTQFDFVYYDPIRIASLYAQMFGGLLSGMSLEDQKSQSKMNSLESAKRGQGESTASAGGSAESYGRSFEPHHLIVVDVLKRIAESKTVESCPVAAKSNAIIRVKGRVAFFDPRLWRVDNPMALYSTTMKTGIDIMLDNALLAVTYVFKSDDEKHLCGVINENGLTDSLGSHYFRYGLSGLGDVILIGIKDCQEIGSVLPANPNAPSPLMASIQKAAQVMNGSILPFGMPRVTPLAIYREI